MSGSNLPVPQSDARVLWSGRAGSGWTAVVDSSTLPGGVRYVTVGTSNAVNRAYGPYSGLLPPGALEHTVLAWGANRPGKPLVVFAVGGLRAEAVLADGDVTRFGAWRHDAGHSGCRCAAPVTGDGGGGPGRGGQPPSRRLSRSRIFCCVSSCEVVDDGLR
jgi:hypothetical protein